MISFDLAQFCRVTMNALLPRDSGQEKLLCVEFDMGVSVCLEQKWFRPEHQDTLLESVSVDGIFNSIKTADRSVRVQLVFMRPDASVRVLIRSAESLNERNSISKNMDGDYVETCYHETCWSDGLKTLDDIMVQIKEAVTTEQSRLVRLAFRHRVVPHTAYDLRCISLRNAEVNSEAGTNIWNIKFLDVITSL